MPHSDENQPCGSWRVLAYVQGYEETVKWCDRTSGPCPYPNTDASSTHAANYTCAVIEAAELGRSRPLADASIEADVDETGDRQ